MAQRIRKSVSTNVDVDVDVELDIDDIVDFAEEASSQEKDILRRALDMPDLSDNTYSLLDVITDLDRESKLELFLSNIDKISHEKLKEIING